MCSRKHTASHQWKIAWEPLRGERENHSQRPITCGHYPIRRMSTEKRIVRKTIKIARDTLHMWWLRAKRWRHEMDSAESWASLKAALSQHHWKLMILALLSVPLMSLSSDAFISRSSGIVRLGKYWLTSGFDLLSHTQLIRAKEVD